MISESLAWGLVLDLRILAGVVRVNICACDSFQALDETPRKRVFPSDTK